MNRKIVFFLISVILTAVSTAMLVSGVLSLFLDPLPGAIRLCGCGSVLLALSAVCAILLRPRNEAEKSAGMREGFAIVGLSWLAATLAGMVPYILVSGFHWYDAFFETASGFSTTGASIVDSNLKLWNGNSLPKGVESLSYGILFWRSLTQWLGGMGIVVLSLAILPLMNIGGQMLYNAEVSGIKSIKSKLAPRIADTAKILWIVYVLLTVLQSLLLRFGGMGWFDSVCHSMCTLATGGFSTKQLSVAHWGSSYIEWIMVIFMYLAGCNFVLHFHVIRKGFKSYLKDEEFRFYAIVVLIASAIIAVSLLFNQNMVKEDPISGLKYAENISGSIRASVFQVVSFITTTGFTTANYTLWPGVACVIVYLLMFITACGGSTTGGIKCVRILLMGKYAISEIRRCLFPHMVQDIRISGIRYENATIQKTIGFCSLFIMLFFLGAMLVAAVSPGMPLPTVFSASITCIANVGPGFDLIGPDCSFSWMPAAAKVILGFEMLLGRLELYTLLVLLMPSFWRR